MTFIRPEFLILGAVMAVVVAGTWWAHARRRRRLADFLGGRRAAVRVSPRLDLYRLQVERLVLVGVVTLALAVAAAEPGFDRSSIPPQVRSVVLAIDVSASMQAVDTDPTRLAQAVRVASELTGTLAEESVGLLLFSGTTYTLAPPTRDLRAIRYFLSGVTPTIASAHDPGTLMSLAIREAAALWTAPAELGEVRSIVLIGDGDAGEPPEAVVAEARAAAARGIHVHVIGVGTQEGSGMVMPNAPYQIEGPVLTESGSPATSRLDERLLERVAEAGVGEFAHVDDAGELDDLRDALTPLPPPGAWWLRYDLPFVLSLIALLGLLVESLLGLRLPRVQVPLRRRKVA